MEIKPRKHFIGFLETRYEQHTIISAFNRSQINSSLRQGRNVMFKTSNIVLADLIWLESSSIMIQSMPNFNVSGDFCGPKLEETWQLKLRKVL